MTDPDPIVFVVDDDASVRDAVKKLLASVGLRVETFGSARELWSVRNLRTSNFLLFRPNRC